MTIQWIASTPEKQWAKCKVAPGPQRRGNLGLDGQAHQTIDGFGGCFNELGWHALSALSAADRAKVIAALFDPKTGCRFNIGRMPIGASDFALSWYSLNENPDDFAMRKFSIARDEGCLIPYIKAALRHRDDLWLFASPWSPPTWMKNPPVYNYGRFLHDKKHLDAYALYFVRLVQAYAKAGVAIRAVHPQNEPTADQKFPSCLWSGAELRDFIGRHLGPAFAKHKIPAEIWLGTINSENFDEYANTVLSDPQAGKFVAGVGYQWGGKLAVQRTHQAWPELDIHQTENECGDGKNTWGYAQYIFTLIHHYLSNGTGAYVYWNMVLPTGGVSTWGWPQNSMVTVDLAKKSATFTPEFHLMKHFSAHVDPGAVRLGLSGPLAGNALAFGNPDGKLVLVVANPLGQERELAFRSADGSFRAKLQAQSWNTFTMPRRFSLDVGIPF
jgi:glucosylceramidase